MFTKNNSFEHKDKYGRVFLVFTNILLRLRNPLLITFGNNMNSKDYHI